MQNRWMKIPVLVFLSVIGLFVVFLPRFVSASESADPPLPFPVAPEPYPSSDIYPAEVYLATNEDLQVLYDLDIDFEGLRTVDGSINLAPTVFTPSVATIYVNPTQAASLMGAGLNLVPIPNVGYRSFLAYGPGSGAPNAWPTFEQYVARMQALEAAHSEVVDLVQIGQSVQGRGLYCMEITDNPGIDEDEPEFKYTANHHGDETTGIEMTMRLAELLAGSYGSDPEITNIVDHMETWICPIYNPDGYTNGTRYNAHGVDLNRDFPDRFIDPIDDPAGREPETQAFMNFGYGHRFVMGANYHGGAQVLNYPYDAIADPYNPEYAPDDQLFINFGIGYTSRNIDLWNGGWPQGITRGWEWYMIYGGMQDWAYYYRGEHHVTLEISNNKMPPFEQMDTYWSHNRDAMLWWMQRAMTGINGLVMDAHDGTPLDATVTLVGRDVPNIIDTDPDVGDYHRVIGDGQYDLLAEASCYQSQQAQVSVVSGTVTTHDFFLSPVSDLSASSKTVAIDHALPGEATQYQIQLENTCNPVTVNVTDTLPSQVTWTGYLTATTGTVEYDSGQILWHGEVGQIQPITITYGISLNQCLPADTNILNMAIINDSINDPIMRNAQLTVENAPPSIPTTPVPADGAIDTPTDISLAWQASTDLNCDQLSYDLYFGTSPTPALAASGLSAPEYFPGLLLPGTQYYWFVVAMDGITEVPGPTWNFTTSANALHNFYLPLARK